MHRFIAFYRTEPKGTLTLIKKPVNIESIPWQEQSEGENFAVRRRVLADTWASENPAKIGVQIQELEPGKQCWPFHYHMLEEEQVLVLSGELTVRLGDERNVMREGDYIRFPAGEEVAHALLNESDAPCRYLIIGDNEPNEVCVYPDSNKVLVRALGRRAVFDGNARLDYWDREDTGE